MPKEPTLIRRYTPPTCTLEIAAQQSPLSRWMGKIALKDLRFKLSFDDPRVSDDDWITLRGDRHQLEALSEAVNRYVQSFLTAGPADRQLLAQPASEHHSEPHGGIALEPKGLLSHQLQLGSLATETSGTTLPLSSTQLSDLAAALDEYAAEATSLPELGRTSWLKQPQNWAGIAAGLLVTVGLSTSLLTGLDKTNRNNPTASSRDQRLAVQPPASPSPTFPPIGNVPLGALPPGKLPPTGPLALPSATTAPTGQPAIAGSPSPSTSIIANGNVPTIDSTGSSPKSGAAQSESAKPEIVSIPNPAAPNITELKPDPIPNSPNLQPDAAIVTPLPNDSMRSSSGAAVLRKQQALESSADALKDAAAPEPPGKRRFEQADALKQKVQQNWKKPETTTSNIEYQVVINADGTLGAVTPVTTDQDQQALGNIAIPAQGSKVAPRSEDGKPSTVRLNLGADGVVNAVPE